MLSRYPASRTNQKPLLARTWSLDTRKEDTLRRCFHKRTFKLKRGTSSIDADHTIYMLIHSLQRWAHYQIQPRPRKCLRLCQWVSSRWWYKLFFNFFNLDRRWKGEYETRLLSACSVCVNLITSIRQNESSKYTAQRHASSPVPNLHL